MAFLNTVINFFGSALVTPSISKPDAMWHVLILNVFGWIKDYGWSIVVFTVLLKLVLSPLDFFQRYKLHKNQRITERLKPTMEKIQKQYGNDKQAFQQKQMELNRKEGYSYFSSCLPMIVTMVVFITLWLSMQTVAQYMTLRDYTRLYDAYDASREAVVTQLDEKAGVDRNKPLEEQTTDEQAKLAENMNIAISFGGDVAYKLYYDGINDEFIEKLCDSYEIENIDISAVKERGRVQASFLWIKNIWAPDVPWGDKALLDWKSFESAIDDFKDRKTNGLSKDKAACINKETYNNVMGKLLADKTQSRTNGYMILPVLVVLLSVGSQLISMFQQKRAGQVNNKGGTATSMKVMMVIMPVMMAVFAIQYASIFTLYMVTNSACTLFFNFLFTSIIRLWDKRKRSRNHGISTGSPRSTMAYKSSPVFHYVKGANPDAGKRLPSADAQAAAGDVGSGVKKSGAKKKKKGESGAKTTTLVRGGRPDPNDLMSYDMTKDNGKKKK